MPPGGIPDRWEEYTPLGKRIPGTRFIAFKVPLNRHLSRQLSDEEKFEPHDLVRLLEEQQITLGLVVDLTNTNRYYQAQAIRQLGIDHIKIATGGHVIPSKEIQGTFFGAIDAFLESNSDNEKLVGVHCTHGLNRTGYLICRYMIDRMQLAPDDVIAAFNAARGYDMERDNYLADLRGEISNTTEGADELKPVSPKRERKWHPYRNSHSNKQSTDNNKERSRFEPYPQRRAEHSRHRPSGSTRQRCDSEQRGYGERTNYREQSHPYGHNQATHQSHGSRFERRFMDRNWSAENDGRWRAESGHFGGYSYQHNRSYQARPCDASIRQEEHVHPSTYHESYNPNWPHHDAYDSSCRSNGMSSLDIVKDSNTNRSNEGTPIDHKPVL